MASIEVREALRKKFPAEKVKQRPGAGQKLDYVAGETVIERLIEATADQPQGYAWQAGVTFVNRDESGDSWNVVVAGQLLIDGDCGTGVGAMSNKDLDMAVKSANTEALKNAAKNGFGVGLELWDKEYRSQLASRRKAIEGDDKALKALVWDIAKKRLGNELPLAADVAALFDVSVGQLSDAGVLKTLLESEGLL
jgi:hypothetical protein